MYQDRDSIKVFQRMHARDRMAQLARQLDHPSDDGYDLFESHARAETKDGRIGIALSVVLFSALAVALTLLLG
jgi:hypothetical protein